MADGLSPPKTPKGPMKKMPFCLGVPQKPAKIQDPTYKTGVTRDPNRPLGPLKKSMGVKKLAETMSQEEFSRLIQGYGLKPKPANGNPISESTIFERFNSKVTAKSARRWARKWGVKGGLFTLASLPDYLKDLNDMNQEDTTDLQKAAVLTSIVPFFGCSVKAAADAKQGRLNVFETVLCHVSDGIMFTPIFPVSVIIKALTFLVDVFTKVFRLTDIGYIKDERAKGWQNQFNEMKKVISSDKYISDQQNKYTAKISAHLYVLAAQKGYLYAGWMKATQNATNSGDNIQEIAKKLNEDWKKVQEEARAKIQATEKHFKKEIPERIGKSTGYGSIKYYARYNLEYQTYTDKDLIRRSKKGMPSWMKTWFKNRYNGNFDALESSKRTIKSPDLKNDVSEARKIAEQSAKKIVQPDLGVLKGEPQDLIVEVPYPADEADKECPGGYWDPDTRECWPSPEGPTTDGPPKPSEKEDGAKAGKECSDGYWDPDTRECWPSPEGPTVDGPPKPSKGADSNKAEKECSDGYWDPDTRECWPSPEWPTINIPDTPDKDMQLELWEAAYSGDTAAMKEILSSGKVNPDVAIMGQSPLVRAASGESEDAVKLLLRTKKVNVNSVDSDDGRTALIKAAFFRSPKIVKRLLDTGKVDVNVKDKREGRTALAWAAFQGDIDSVKALLATGKVDVNIKDNQGKTPAQLAKMAWSWFASTGKKGLIVQLLNDYKGPN
ncbi:hypothetical protein CDD81_4689 [Ophiocordyceps australis]|uniref:Uncharacterized protein n=1 Tax=Ophiocordyceps australis TaxID=1399860 RepID=A0A2C5YAP4_9HYPO|nr:hypothetical protein CDD81_4689 [Ophiocordyceps australis]